MGGGTQWRIVCDEVGVPSRILLGAGDSFDGPDRSHALRGMDSDGAMPSCLSGVHVRQDSSRNKFTPQIRGGVGRRVPELHSFHLGLLLSHYSGTQG